MTWKFLNPGNSYYIFEYGPFIQKHIWWIYSHFRFVDVAQKYTFSFFGSGNVVLALARLLTTLFHRVGVTDKITIWQEIHLPLITNKISLNISYRKFHPNLSGASEIAYNPVSIASSWYVCVVSHCLLNYQTGYIFCLCSGRIKDYQSREVIMYVTISPIPMQMIGIHCK